MDMAIKPKVLKVTGELGQCENQVRRYWLVTLIGRSFSMSSTLLSASHATQDPRSSEANGEDHVDS